jgi:hypothetical protein
MRGLFHDCQQESELQRPEIQSVVTHNSDDEGKMGAKSAEAFGSVAIEAKSFYPL